MRKTLKNIIMSVITLALLAGCSLREVPPAPASDISADSETAVSFTLPAYIPRALVDCAGYETGAEKTVLFRTDEAGDFFELRTVSDDTVVYTGTVKTFKRAGSGMSYGQFSSFQTPGEYYVYTEGTGSSYSFGIEENLNTQKLTDALGRFYALRCGMSVSGTGLEAGIAASPCHTQPARLQKNPDIERDVYGGWHTDAYGSRNTIEGCDALRDLLLCMEIYSDKFVTTKQGESGKETNRESNGKDLDAGSPSRGDLVTDNNPESEVKYEMQWLLRMQDDNGGVYGSVLTGGNEMSVNLTLTEISTAATVAFADVMARAAYVFRNADPAVSEQALAAAGKAWEYYTGHETPTANTRAFAAASELYRLTGAKKYENVLSAFFTKPGFTKLLREEDDIFYGSYSYMNTTQPVNVEVCNTIMSTLLEDAENIAARANASAYFVSAEETEKILQDMLRLAVANDVIYNHEYTNILENHVHYLYGRNANATNHVTGDRDVTAKGFEDDSIYAKPTRLARFICLLAAL